MIDDEKYQNDLKDRNQLNLIAMNKYPNNFDVWDTNNGKMSGTQQVHICYVYPVECFYSACRGSIF